MEHRESGLATIRQFIEVIWNQGKVERVREFVHPAYSIGGVGAGPDWVATNVARFRRAFPDLTVSIEQAVAQDGVVATRLRMRGTHLGQWKDFLPSGRRVDYEEAAFWRIDRETGLIASGDFVANTLVVRIQIGALPETIWSKPLTTREPRHRTSRHRKRPAQAIPDPDGDGMTPRDPGINPGLSVTCFSAKDWIGMRVRRSLGRE
jgi:predicted ester cyclase